MLARPMMPARLSAVAVTALLALAPSIAQSAEVVPNQAIAQRIAAETFPSACSSVVVRVGPLQNGPLADAEASLTDCSITFAPNVYASHPDEVCGKMVHEYGHLADYYDPAGVEQEDGTVDHSHSPDPDSIMYPVWGGGYQPCVDAGDAALSAVDRVHWFRHVVADRQRAARHKVRAAARMRAQGLLVRARARLERALHGLDPAAVQYAVDLRTWSVNGTDY